MGWHLPIPTVPCVPGVKRDPPGVPMAAQLSTEQSNAALLTWCPAPDVHHRPPSAYIVERREAAGGSWVQCLSTELPGRVQVLGDSVPREADYCFRVCAVNKHGRSDPVEFPGCVHLGEGTQDLRAGGSVGAAWCQVLMRCEAELTMCCSASCAPGEGSAGCAGAGWRGCALLGGAVGLSAGRVVPEWHEAAK